MRTFEPSAGTRIDEACRQAVALAVEHDTEVRFVFNDIALSAKPTDRPQLLADRWHSILTAKQEAYERSPEGIAAKAARANAIIRQQAELDAIVDALPKILRVDGHLDALVKWVKEITSAADDVAVKWSPQVVADQLEAAGYQENEHVGQSPDWFNCRERMGRYIVGQAINGMRIGMGPHPIAQSFADRYFKLPAREAEITT
jgi:hypothetical protein